jgi:NAD(P)H dehydrogenase (quinone)
MRALVVHAHPEPTSFNAALRDVAVSTLRAQGYGVHVSDLYVKRFKATVDRDDFRTPLDAAKFNVTLDALLAADLVVFQFPLWWFSMPAILKGWFDRVFVSGAVYGRQHLFERGKLRGKRALLSVTTGGPEAAFGPSSLNGDILDILMPIHRGILGFTGMTVLPPFVAYFVPYAGVERRREMLEQYASHLTSLDRIAPLAMPRVMDHLPVLAELLRAEAR